MPKIFKERKINADSILGINEFRFFSDAKSTEFIPSKIDRIIKRAEEWLGTDIPLLPASVYLEFKTNGNRSNYQNIYFKRRYMARDLALAEYYEKKGRFTVKLMDVLWAIMEESTWILPAHLYLSPTHGESGLPPVFNEERIHGIDLFSASTAAALAIIYMYTKDELDKISPVVCEKLRYMIKERITKPFLNVLFWWSGELSKKTNNWCPWIVSNVLITTAVIEEDIYIRRAVVTRSLKFLDNFTDDYGDDGGCSEGPSYWGAAGASYFDCLELLYDMSGGSIDVYDHPFIKALLEYIAKFNICGTRFINFADCAPSCHHDGAMIRRMGEKCNSEALVSFGDRMAMISDGAVLDTHFYRGLRNLMTETPTVCTDIAVKKIWFPDLKVMITRESEIPSTGMFVAMKGGTNAEHHNHNDVGNVVVYCNGNPVLIDTGVGEYTKQTFSSRRYELWYMQSEYHNLPFIGGYGQKNGDKFISCDEEYNEETGGVKMQLAKAYSSKAGIISFKRETVLDDKSRVHIIDEIQLDYEKEVDFRYMSCVKPEILEDGRIRLSEGRTMIYDRSLSVEIEEFEVNDSHIEISWKSKVLWRLHFKTSFKEGKFEFIVE